MNAVLGIVGAGPISKFHCDAFAETRTPVRIVADVDAARGKACAERFGATGAADWRQVVSHSEVNTVGVFTPTSLHYPIVKAALSAGKHVICEKTLTLSPTESLELARLAESKGVLLYTSYMKRYFPAAQKARELAPALGHIMSVYAWAYHGWAAAAHTGELPEGPEAFQGLRKTTGGGMLIAGGSHIVDLLLFLVDKPLTVCARRFVRPDMDLDFMCHALMDLPGGGVVHFEASLHPLKKIGYQGRGWDEGIEITGQNGRLVLQTPVWDIPETAPAQLAYYDDRAETWTNFAFDPVDPFVLAERHFLAQIRKGEQGPQDRYTGYRTDYLLEAARLSAVQSRMIELKWEA